jgi:hypothetical protein
MLKVPVAVAVTAFLLAAAPGAAQAKTYRGKTSQGRSASLTTGSTGVVSRVRLSWRAPCGQNKRYATATVFKPPFDAATGDTFQDAGTYKLKDRKGFVGRITMTVTAQRSAAADTWTGTLAVTVQVARNGKVLDHCSAKRLKWSAK